MRYWTCVNRDRKRWCRSGRRPRSDPGWPRELLLDHHRQAQSPRSRDRRRLGECHGDHRRPEPSRHHQSSARPLARRVWPTSSGPVAPPPRIRRYPGPDGGHRGVHLPARAVARPVAQCDRRRVTGPRHPGAGSNHRLEARVSPLVQTSGTSADEAHQTYQLAGAAGVKLQDRALLLQTIGESLPSSPRRDDNVVAGKDANAPTALTSLTNATAAPEPRVALIHRSIRRRAPRCQDEAQ